MQYFKKPDGSVWAFEDDVTAESGWHNGTAFVTYITADMVAMTAAEIEAHINPPPTQAQLFAASEGAAQAALDAQAQAWGYDSLVSAASYVGSSVAQYAAESRALIAWRDALWQAAYALQEKVKGGTATMPASTAAFLALLPAAPTRPSRTIEPRPSGQPPSGGFFVSAP